MKTTSLFRWTKDQFRTAADAGWFADRKAELLGGLVFTATPNPPHMTATLNLEDLFANLLSRVQWFIAREIPRSRWVAGCLSPTSPSKCRNPRDHYTRQLPTHRDVALIVEVSDSTYARDRGRKYRRHARRRIPVYWIVDLNRSLVEVYTDPGPRGYRRSETYLVGDSVPVIIDGQAVGQILVSDILP